MEMPIQNSIPQGWSCPRCGELNGSESRFCRKCGGENVVPIQGAMNQSPVAIANNTSRGSVGKVVLIIFLLLLLLGGAAVGAYFWYQSNQNKIAKEYIVSEKSNFEGVIKSINGLSTEEKIERIDEKTDDFFSKIEDEKNKAEKALSDARSAKDKNDKSKTNNLISGIDSLFKKFYSNAVEKLAIYSKYLNYQYQTSKLDKEFDENVTKASITYKNDMVGYYREIVKIFEGYRNQYNSLTPPEGMEEVHKKTIELFDRQLTLSKNLLVAIDAKDNQKVNSAATELENFTTEEAPGLKTEIYKKEKYFYKTYIHDGFANVKDDAENVKNQIVPIGVKLNMEVNNLSVNIESW